MNKTKILLVDDHEVVLVGLKTVLQRNPRFEVVGEANTGRDGIEKAFELEPNVVVMDIRMQDISGIEACREIKNKKPGINVIMLTSYADDEAVMASIMAGAAGYVLKEIGSQALINAVETVSRGQGLLDPKITQKVLARMKAEPEKGILPELAQLSNQERKILSLMAEGKTNKEIAEAIFLSENTVRNYVSNILHKLNFGSRAQAIAFGIRHQL